MLEQENNEFSRLHALITGRVQGVGFRAFIDMAARDLGLAGWVRNRWDGSVEVLAEGEKHKLEQLLAAVRRGPRGANVSDVRVEWLAATGEFHLFSVRMTG